ncbi:MAG: RNA polymerase sigma factor [Planctomycetota bacterium]
MSASYGDDLQLVRGALRGDARAAAELAGRLECIGRFVRYLNRRTIRLRDDELEDVEQDVLASVWERLGDYAGLARLESWVFPFCRNVLRNAGRQERRGRMRWVDDGQARVAATPAPEAAEEFDPGPVLDCVDRLPPEDRALLRRKHFDGATLQDLAAWLGCNLNTLKSRYFRALLRVRQCLARTAEDAQ